jgi:hypothetical protein
LTGRLTEAVQSTVTSIRMWPKERTVSESKRTLGKTTTVADAAVEGLLSGIAAGFAMAASLIGMGMVTGDTPASVLGRFDPGGRGAPVTGGLAHLAVSGVYGILFGLGWHRVHRRLSVLPDWVGGLVYGMALLGLAETLLLPGTGSPLGEIPAAQFALAHAVYGLSLGLLSGRHSTVGMARHRSG